MTAGETVLVLGPSGSGKSTLTLCLDGLIPHMVEGDYSGRVAVAGLVVKDTPVHVLAQETGLVFQDPEVQFCTLTVEDEIAFGLENLRRPPEQIEPAIDQALASVGLGGYRARRLSTLSGGEKQRVALAAVLAMGPGVLVLDEPSANLDPRATLDLFALLREIASDRRHTILMIEHKLDELIGWIDSVLVLDPDGRMLLRGDPRTAFYESGEMLAEVGVWRPQTVELVSALRKNGWEVPGRPLSTEETVAALEATASLSQRLRGVPAPLGPSAPLGPGASVDRGTGGMAPKPFADSAAAGQRSAGGEADLSAADGDNPGRLNTPLLRVAGLSYRYPGAAEGVEALTDVCFTVERGEFAAIVGVNGAGKSTLGGLVSGVLQPPRGAVFLEGSDIAGLTGRAISDRVGHVFQNPEHQFVSDTVIGELAFSLSPKAGRAGGRHLTAEQLRRAESWLARLGLLPLAEANPFSLSQGQKRRLSVAAMLIRGQSALVLDEPTLGQDELQSARLMALMEDFRAEGGAVLMITHDMRLVSLHATSLLVLVGGRAAFTGDPKDFFSQPGLVARAGLAVPALGRVSAGLGEMLGAPQGLLTVQDFTRASGDGPGATERREAGG